MEEFINIVKDEKEVNMMSPLTWAYIGDCVYELYIRTQLVNTTNLKPHKLHIESIKYVKAQSQASFLQRIYDDLTDGEKEIVRRGRNTENHHLPKNCNVQDYSTPIFAISRIAGWSAHRLEELVNRGKIIRPAYKYVGHHRPFVDAKDRGTTEK